jgi:gluconokinase
MFDAGGWEVRLTSQSLGHDLELMPQAQVFAIDLGTTTLKAAVWGADGRLVRGTEVATGTPLASDGLGAATIDPERLRVAVIETIDRSMATSAGRLAAWGWSTFWHSLVGVDSKGECVTPVFTWADTRAAEVGRALGSEWDVAEAHRRTGCMPGAIYWPAKLRWVREAFPVPCGRVWRWMSAAEWLQGTFCGEWRCGIGMACATGLMDQARGDWDPAALTVSGWNARHFNPISDTPLRLAPPWARRWPRLTGIPITPAIGDGAAGTLGSGADSAETLAINLGTSAAVRRMVDASEPRAPFGLFDYRIDVRRRLVGAAISNAGNVLAWMAALLNLDTADALRDLTGPGSGGDGVICVPDWLQERAPDSVRGLWPGGILAGIRPGTSRQQLFDAACASVLRRVAAVVHRVDPAEKATPILSGGLARWPCIARFLADMAGRPVEVSAEPEASLRGAAILALRAADLADPLPPGRTPALPYPTARARWEAVAVRAANLAGSLAEAPEEARATSC